MKSKSKIIKYISSIILLASLCITGFSTLSNKLGVLPDKKIPNTTAAGSMSVSFLNVGQGDATLVQTSSKTLLIDTGSYANVEMLLNELNKKNVTTIDYLILTHPDEDHIGSTKTVLNTYSVKQVIVSGQEKDSEVYNLTNKAIQTSGAQKLVAKIGDVYSLGDAAFTIIGPKEIIKDDSNNSSVAIKLVHGSKSFVMCGDAEGPEESAILESNYMLEADVLKCGHHGSSTATSDAFLAAVNPSYAIVSCGAGNKYGHPHAEVIDKLNNDDVQIYRTDLLGTITAISDGTQISFKSGK